MNSMRNRGVFPFLLSIFIIAYFCIGGCGGGDGDHENDQSDRRDIIVTLLNDPSNQEPIHILSPGESLSPDNRLLPGESRDVFLAEVRIEEAISFRAGREGEICQTAQCIPFGDIQDFETDFFLVTWEEPDPGLDFFLACEEGFAGTLGNFGNVVCILPPLQ